jgi:hypothetical protein
MALWEDHLLPLLTCKDAARLRSTCKALRVVVREHFGALGRVHLKNMQAALTTFPRARSMELYTRRRTEEFRGKEALVQWLRQEGRGRHLVKVWSLSRPAQQVVHEALREGALPSLKGMDVSLFLEGGQELLTWGILGAMHELRVTLNRDDHAQRAALDLVRQLPSLVALDVYILFRCWPHAALHSALAQEALHGRG